MLDTSWREETWTALDQLWDVIVIGGGITGAGIFNMAAQKGLKVVLLEAKDFAFGTSSRSSKLIHGGIRYLRNRQIDVVRESVKERQRLLHESDNLVTSLPFIFPTYEHNSQEAKLMKIGVVTYDLMAPKWQHRNLNKKQVINSLPALNDHNLVGGIEYHDALVDDSQLVLRVIMDGIRFGGVALNYAKVIQLCQAKNGFVEGVLVEDQTETLSPRQLEICGNVIINATGPWSDNLRLTIGGAPRLRPLRGSHLVFSQEKLPLRAAVTLYHPRDKRAMFAIPWENRTIIGTTDLDHHPIDDETRISREEVDYLLEAAQKVFDGHQVTEADIISTFSGLRPVVNTNAATPSKESRAHKIWQEDGLVTIAGGKLTIFRVMAADVLNICTDRLPNQPKFSHRAPCFIHPRPEERANAKSPHWPMMAGRLGKDVNRFFNESNPDLMKPIDPLPALWAELPWAAKNEAVAHLDDLLLRRVRLGILLPNGGLDKIDTIKQLVQHPLGWTDKRWMNEVENYSKTWRENYSLPN